MSRPSHMPLVGLAMLCAGLWSLVGGIGEVSAAESPPWRQHLRCDSAQQHFRGLEYCTPTDQTSYHVIVVDLHEAGIGLQYIMPNGLVPDDNAARRKIGECKDVNRSTKQLGGPGCDDPDNDQFYPVMSLEVAKDLAQARFPGTAVVVNSDYGAKEPSDNQTKWRDHGPEGFTVVRGNRLDGKRTGDGDNNAEKRPWLAVGQQVPLRAELGQFASGRDDGGKPAWIYTAVGGAPWLIRSGVVQYEDIDKCTQASGSCYDGAAQTAVGLGGDGRWLFLVIDERQGQARLSELAEFMQSQLGVRDAIKFDGGGSTQLWYDGATVASGDGRQLSQYLAVVASPGHGINDAERPAFHASSVPALVYDVVLPGETVQLAFELRNEGQNAWSGPGFEFVALAGNLPGAPESLALQGEVTPGNTVTLIVRAPVAEAPGLRSVRYQMQHDGEPFGDSVTGYVFVLPQELKDLEQQIRDQITQWQQQSQQSVEELLKQIGDMIAQAAAQQAQSLIDKLLEQCCASISLAGFGIALVTFGRRARGGRRRR